MIATPLTPLSNLSFIIYHHQVIYYCYYYYCCCCCFIFNTIDALLTHSDYEMHHFICTTKFIKSNSVMHKSFKTSLSSDFSM